jgi:osmotically-inducible protein OsmY
MKSEPEVRYFEEEAQKRMNQSLYPEVKRIVCNYRKGKLTLYGVVSSFHARRIAEALVEDLEGVEVVDNQLVVNAPPLKSRPGLGK